MRQRCVLLPHPWDFDVLSLSASCFHFLRLCFCLGSLLQGIEGDAQKLFQTKPGVGAAVYLSPEGTEL